MGSKSLKGKLAYAYYAQEYVLILGKVGIHDYYKVLMKNKISIVPKKNLILNIEKDRKIKYDTTL